MMTLGPAFGRRSCSGRTIGRRIGVVVDPATLLARRPKCQGIAVSHKTSTGAVRAGLLNAQRKVLVARMLHERPAS